MKNIKALSLLAIAVILLIELWINHVWPPIVLAIYHEEFHNSAVACHVALASYRDSNDISRDLQGRAKNDIDIAAQIQLVECHQNEYLRLELLSSGVNEAKLEMIKLKALENSEVPLSLLVNPYRLRER